jgi:hypothetical protein
MAKSPFFRAALAKVEIGELHARVGGNGRLKLRHRLGAPSLAKQDAPQSVEGFGKVG